MLRRTCDALTAGLRRATDALRAVLERTRGDVTTALVVARIQDAIGGKSAGDAEGGGGIVPGSTGV